jgi:glycosyltransferase involved in cell wall biosynthesis
MIEGLRRTGVEVVECHESLWHSIEDRVQVASGGWRTLSFWQRLLGVYWRLLQRYRQVGDYDLLVVGYPGALDIFLARVLAWLRGKPLVWDVFMSIYLIAVERHLAGRSALGVKLLFALEWIALRLPDLLIQDTAEYVAWLSRTYGLKSARFRLVPTGADERLFKSEVSSAQMREEGFRVLYYGTFIPNHGVPYIMEAARRLRSESDIHFELVGRGPDREGAQEFARENRLASVTFVDWLNQEALVRRIAAADICLGAFGDTPQSLMTVQNKIYECLAMGKPVVTGDSPAVREALIDRVQIYLVARTDGTAIAQAIADLRANEKLRHCLGVEGEALFLQRYTIASLGERYVRHLREVL